MSVADHRTATPRSSPWRGRARARRREGWRRARRAPTRRGPAPVRSVLAGLYRETLVAYASWRRPRTRSPSASGLGLLYISTVEDAAGAWRRRSGPVPRLGCRGHRGRRAARLEPVRRRGAVGVPGRIGYPVAPGASTSCVRRPGRGARAVGPLRTERPRSRPGAMRGRGARRRPPVLAGAVCGGGPWTPALLDPSGRWATVANDGAWSLGGAGGGRPRHVLEEAGIEAVLDAAEPAERTGAAPRPRESTRWSSARTAAGRRPWARLPAARARSPPG